MSPTPFDPATLSYDARGLIPAIAQDHRSGEVLMLAWMSAATVAETLATGRVTYWSRSRAAPWRKGETSGHVQCLVEFRVADPASGDARYCLDAYFDELNRRFDDGFDPARSIPAPTEDLTLPRGLLLLARLRGEPVGCGVLSLPEARPPEIKRMWVDPAVRGLGLGRRILAELEERAREQGARSVRLETNRNLHEAVALYRSAGYEEVAPFNEEPYAHHWFEKRLEGEPEPQPPVRDEDDG